MNRKKNLRNEEIRFSFLLSLHLSRVLPSLRFLLLLRQSLSLPRVTASASHHRRSSRRAAAAVRAIASSPSRRSAVVSLHVFFSTQATAVAAHLRDSLSLSFWFAWKPPPAASVLAVAASTSQLSPPSSRRSAAATVSVAVFCAVSPSLLRFSALNLWILRPSSSKPQFRAISPLSSGVLASFWIVTASLNVSAPSKCSIEFETLQLDHPLPKERSNTLFDVRITRLA